jgi:uncharacterized protein (DUF433 family)
MASETPVARTEYAHIVSTPGTVGGEPRIAGHRIRVRDIVAARDFGGYTPEEIASSVYPNLSLAQVYSALAYYEDHRGDIGRLFQEESRLVEEFRRQNPQVVHEPPSGKE